MSQTYIELTLLIAPLPSGRDIAIAFLSNQGYESFVETDRGLQAFIQEKDWTADLLDALYPLVENGLELNWSLKTIPPQNWNAVWESDFVPIIVEDRCAIRAHFHAPIDVPIEIVITPKMSFGTGHHQTTYMMMQYLLNYPPKGQSVLDMGCGTGVLAILAEKLGADQVEAIDVETWCVENTKENIKQNNCNQIAPHLGDRNAIPEKTYSTILANINMNVLLVDLSLFAKLLSSDGKVYLSGFFHQNLPAIETKANQCGMKLVDYKEKENWVAAHFIKR